jgi:hypothetical protein
MNTWNKVFSKYGPQMDAFFKDIFRADKLGSESVKKGYLNLIHDIKNTLLIHTSNEF